MPTPTTRTSSSGSSSTSPSRLTEWKLAVKTPELLKTIKSLLPRVDVVVNAGDPDREGQLLVDEVLYFLNYRGPVERVLISDLNPAAVRKALGALQPNAKFRRLYDAAVGRQRADWLYGINMTRLYTVLGRAAGYQGGTLSIGRVQTPLLGLIVRRDLEIENFVPKAYFSLVADVAGAAHPFAATWQPGDSADHAFDDEGRLVDRGFAAAIERQTNSQPATVSKASRDKKSEAAPLPYSLAELQIDAGRRLGLNPQAVLSICQALYERHRLTTYPTLRLLVPAGGTSRPGRPTSSAQSQTSTRSSVPRLRRRTSPSALAPGTTAR